MAASASEIEDFLSGPLVKWLSTCIKKPETLQVYETFFDGAPINEVLLLIDPEPSKPVPSISNLQGFRITTARVKVFHCIVRNIRAVYEDELGQVVVSVPNCVVMGRTPASQAALEQLKLLILLLLGCAVQGPTKEVFIGKIKQLSVEDQHDIVECIKRVTDDQSIVLTQDWPDQAPQRLYSHIRALTIEREKLVQQWVTDLGQETSMLEPNNKYGSQEVESNHLAVELADWKARMRRQRQELEEKSEILMECKEELEHCKSIISKLKNENVDLLAEARHAKAYRDEMDSMRERLERADQLEAEARRCRQRLDDAEFLRSRVREQRDECAALVETRDLLEGQLEAARRRGDRVVELAAELAAAQQVIAEMEAERDSARDKIQQLLEENAQLQQHTRSAMQESTAHLLDHDSDDTDSEEEPRSADTSLGEQLGRNAQARALHLELENRRLAAAVEQMRDGELADLEAERRRLEAALDRMGRRHAELEAAVEGGAREGRQLQEALDAQKVIMDRQNAELHNERARLTELENNIEHVTKEKQRIQDLCDAAKKRADDSEKALAEATEQLSILQSQEGKVKEMEKAASDMAEKVAVLEKENGNLAKEIAKLKTTLETKDVVADETAEQMAKLDKELQRLNEQNARLSAQLARLQDAEQRSQELVSQASVHADTIATLQRDLVNEKVRAGLDQLAPPSLGAANELLQKENATLKVEAATWRSQVHSLQAQQTALQLANGQLVVEKEELIKKQQIQSSQHDTLLLDQATLRTLHEQLSLEYEEAKREQDTLRKMSRDLRSELRSLREDNEALRARLVDAEVEKEALRSDSENLANLRSEHSKLRDDFRGLFMTRSQEIQSEKEEIRELKMEVRRLRLERTEMMGELNLRSDAVASFQLDNTQLQQDREMLLTLNLRLDSDRRALMEHSSQLLTQFQELLNHSLEDKQHFHMEERQYMERVNSLRRQKERLEEKIMEHYRNMDNASKKKGFGATFVRRVRKAGTDIINRVPSRNRRSWHDDSARMTQSQATLLNDGSGESNGNDSDSDDERREVAPAGQGQRATDESNRSPPSHRNSLADDHRTSPQESTPALSLGSVGSRRTVYLPEEDPTPIAASLPPPNPPMLVYNKISTVIGELQQPSGPPLNEPCPPEGGQTGDEKGGRSAKETAVWYEYGCV